MSLPAADIVTPLFKSDLVPLHFQPDILLDPQTQTRWKVVDESLVRDLDGESDWEQMAQYVNQSYSDVFMSSFRASLDARISQKIYRQKSLPPEEGPPRRGQNNSLVY